VTTGAPGYHLPAVDRILEVGLLVPVAAFVAVVIAPLVVSARPAFRHPMDVVVACSLSGAALSLGLSVVVQHGAFTHIQATAGDPAHVAFIALTLGFLQPIVLATAATVGVLGLRRLGVNPAAGVVEGLGIGGGLRVGDHAVAAVRDTGNRVDRVDGVRLGRSGIGRGQ